MRILIVDDDPRLRETLRVGLAHSGHEAEGVPDADGAEAALANGHYDIVLLDVMMPGRTGWSLLETVRARGDDTPVIFLTARDAVEERVRGLSAGADDYMSKPFSLDELLARIEAIARRRASLPTIFVGPLSIDQARRTCVLEGRRIELSPREFDLLAELARANGDAVSRKHLLSKVWGIDFDPETNTVDVHVARLRRRLGPNGKHLVRTVVGEGYRLAADSEDEA
ncbi:MAG: response regulator transcription factor [Planctomycetota bacterium]